jgi:hypothetical protein
MSDYTGRRFHLVTVVGDGGRPSTIAPICTQDETCPYCTPEQVAENLNRDGLRFQRVLSCGVTVGVDASLCIVIRTPERTITVTNVDTFKAALDDARDFQAVAEAVAKDAATP